ncbi:MAG: RNA polymerase sigma factor SigJ [Rhodospirillum sp.]|nr:RNA polymerase sigma factor SigJ [Rhodospirillum sp.]MCF8488652.1 RNA polymerase sigma factor SigJ [Rhodospirillum sp.]MCF8501743.1 RNA polymerase sigma factor SigJ [Rhodospirillum sp.]
MDLFWSQRPRLLGLAYRMLGDRAAAEDVVQDSFIRWRDVDPDTITNPAGYLTRVVTHLSIDALRVRQRLVPSYPGPWLPEPIGEADHGPMGLGEDISAALMMALERLSPLERAVFLLHDIFETEFSEIATTLGRTPEACRQLASRARRAVAGSRRRYPLDVKEGARLVEAFFLASRGGDVAALERLLTEDAVLFADGGGIRSAALRPIVGRDRVVRFCAGLARKAGFIPPEWRQEERITGTPGLVTLEADGLPQVTLVEPRVGRIAAIYVIRNPLKLKAFLK